LEDEQLEVGRETMLDKLQRDLDLTSTPKQTINIDNGGRIKLITKICVDMSRVASLKKYYDYYE
jgi:hypothetical protein